MKQSPQDKILNRNLRASKFSAEGFLGNDLRPLDEIIAADSATLERLGVSVETVVEVLRNAYQQARQALDLPVTLKPGITAEYFEARGKVPSPFRGEGVFEKGEVRVKEQKTGDTLIVTALGIHLIAKHTFFQGHGSRYRIEPDAVVRLLI